MKRYFEVYFRHPLRFTLPVIVAITAAVGYEVHAPRSYISTATLWCDASLPNLSTIAGDANLPTTPSADKQAVLLEFLHTQTFDDAIARHTPMAAELATESPVAFRASADAIAGSVTLSTPGPQVLGISVKGASPVIAQGILQAVIAEFTAELTTTLQQRAQSLATLDQTQVTASAVTLANAQAALATYLRTHPAAGTLTDPEANLLESEVNAALQQHNSAEGTFTQNQQEAVGATDPNAFHVIDAPSMPVLPEPRAKRLIEAGVGGLLAGGLITVAALVLLVVMDTTIRTAEDVTTAFGLPTVAIVGVHDLDPLIKHRRRQARRGEALA